MIKMQKVLLTIDSINERIGKIVAWLLIPLTLVIVCEVMLRYVFNVPAIWAWDVNIQLQGLIVIFGGGYAFLSRSHVSIDILVSKLPTRGRALLDAIMAIFIVGGISLLLWQLSLYAWNSVMMRETLSSAWRPAIYPLKVTMVIAVTAMLLQAIAIWVRDLNVVIHGKGAP